MKYQDLSDKVLIREVFKTKMKFLLTIILILSFQLNEALCQDVDSRIVLSPYVDFNILDLDGSGIIYNRKQGGEVYEKYEIYFGEGNTNMQGYRIGILATHHWGSKIIYYRLSYFHNTGFVTIKNLHPEEEAVLGTSWTGFLEGYTYKRFESAIKIDLIKIRKISFGVGLQAFYQLKDPQSKISDDYYNNPVFPSLKQYRIVSNVASSSLSFVVGAELNAKYRFGPLLLGVNFERSLTPISSSITYNGVESHVEQNFQIWSFSVSYDLLKWPKQARQ